MSNFTFQNAEKLLSSWRVTHLKIWKVKIVCTFCMLTYQWTDGVVTGILKRWNERGKREIRDRIQFQFKHLLLGNHDGKVLQMNQGSKLQYRQRQCSQHRQGITENNSTHPKECSSRLHRLLRIPVRIIGD